MKEHLRGLVDWLEAAHLRSQPCGSEFEQLVPWQALNWAEAAFDWAISTQHQVILYSRSASASAVVVALVLRRAGLQIENVFNRNLSDVDFDKLAAVMGVMNRAAFRIVEGWPSVSKQMTDGQYVFLC